PNNAAARFALAVALEKRGQEQQALEHYLAVPSDAADGPKAALRAAILQCRLGEYESALKLLEGYNTTGSEKATVLFYRGFAHASGGNTKAAIADWTELRQLQPNNERLLLNLARVHYLRGAAQMQAGRFPEAISSWEEYLRLYPADEKAARDIAELHMRMAGAEIA